MVEKKKTVEKKDVVKKAEIEKKEESVKKDSVEKKDMVVKKDEGVKKDEVVKFNFHNKLKKMYLTPTAFFKSEGENSYQSLLRTFVLFYVFYFILTLIINFNSISTNIQVLYNLSGPQGMLPILFAFIVYGILFPVLIAFVFPGIMHLVSILIGIKGNFFNTYKAGIYTLVLWTFYSIILFLVSLVLPFDSQGLQVALTGIQDSGEIPNLIIDFLKANPGSLVSLLISAIIHLHILVFGIKALSAFQKISRGKSALVMVVSMVVTFIAQVGIISYFISRSQGLTP
jgi:hypothetical protein